MQMLNKFLIILFLVFPSISYAKTRHQALIEQRDRILKAVQQCSKDFKKLDEDKKFLCHADAINLNSLNIDILQDQILNLQLNTTGY